MDLLRLLEAAESRVQAGQAAQAVSDLRVGVAEGAAALRQCRLQGPLRRLMVTGPMKSVSEGGQDPAVLGRQGGSPA